MSPVPQPLPPRLYTYKLRFFLQGHYLHLICLTPPGLFWLQMSAPLGGPRSNRRPTEVCDVAVPHWPASLFQGPEVQVMLGAQRAEDNGTLRTASWGTCR